MRHLFVIPEGNLRFQPCPSGAVPSVLAALVDKLSDAQASETCAFA